MSWMLFESETFLVHLKFNDWCDELVITVLFWKISELFNKLQQIIYPDYVLVIYIICYICVYSLIRLPAPTPAHLATVGKYH